MPALDFPSSPTDGQVYQNWIYNTAKGAWKAKPLTPGQAQVSATAPATPSNGDQWYNTNDGNLYVYYNDGDTSQWVQIKSDATLSSTLGPRVDALELAPAGLVRVVPTSVAVGSGSATVSSTGTVSFTSVSSVSLNGCFSSAYRSYKVLIQVPSAAASAFIYSRLRASGTDNTTGLYFSSLTRANFNGSSVSFFGAGLTNAFYLNEISNSYGASVFSEVTFNDPANASTKTLGNVNAISNSGTSYSGLSGGLAFDGSASFDGLTVFPSTSTITGTIQVYGFRN